MYLAPQYMFQLEWWFFAELTAELEGGDESLLCMVAQTVDVGADRGTKRQKMPEHEFQALREIKATEKNGKKACRFWNSSIGCSAPEGTCAFAHDLCILCGQNHRWCEHHQPSKSGSRR